MSWVDLMSAAALGPTEICGASAGERDLVAWRRQSGAVVVMDARCPHQWSHLEAEGVVDGEEIVCTSHFWRFDAQGCGTQLDRAGRRDPTTAIETFPSREHDGRIEVWLPA